MWKYTSDIYNKSIQKGACQVIILLARPSDYKYNSDKILRFLTGGYYGMSGGEFHI